MMVYIIAPFFAWIIAGFFKFIINYIRYGKDAVKLIGYGGFPSTHTTILATVVSLCGLEYGFYNPIFSLGLGILLLFIIDAHGLRRKIGAHAHQINMINEVLNINENQSLRERMGHSWAEITGGLILGIMVGLMLHFSGF